MPNAKITKKRLIENALIVCRFLLPDGFFDGANWRVGNIRGDSGQSLSVCLLTGLWNDFAEPGHHGDIIKLWMMVRGVSFTAALAQAEEWLRNRPKADEPCAELRSEELVPARRIQIPRFWNPRIENFWRTGADFVRNDRVLQAALDEWRGWTCGTAEALSHLDLIAYLTPWGDARGAFKVECPVETWLTPVGIHARPVKDPSGGRAAWFYRPSLSKDRASIPALPFVLGGDQFNEADLVVICEGQWDAITWAAAAGWLSPTCPMPPGVTIFGIRGSGTWGHLLNYWNGRWPAHAAFLLVPDGDNAGRAWHGDFASALRQRADTVVILDPPPGKDFSDLNVETPFDPPAIQRLLRKYNLPIVE